MNNFDIEYRHNRGYNLTNFISGRIDLIGRSKLNEYEPSVYKYSRAFVPSNANS